MSISSFAPIVNINSKILILGTMPGRMSLKREEYYGHRRNSFWKIVHEILNKPYSENYNEKKQMLLSNKIAVWDVLKYCDRESSLDIHIQNEIVNDFSSFYLKYPFINTVFFNGKKAMIYYEQSIGLEEHLNFYTLPSTSPANTTKSYNEKVQEWSKIVNYLSS